MNRLAVYSYLTRYPYGCTGSGRLFTVPLSEKDNSYNYGWPFKMRCWTREKHADNYQMLVWSVQRTYCSCLGCTVLEEEADDLGTLFSNRKKLMTEKLCSRTTGQLDTWTSGLEDKRRTPFPGSDVGLDTARVR